MHEWRLVDGGLDEGLLATARRHTNKCLRPSLFGSLIECLLLIPLLLLLFLSLLLEFLA